MAKDFGASAWMFRSPFFVFGPTRKEFSMNKGKKIVAFRKTCKATGTGLSHYILMDRKGK